MVSIKGEIPILPGEVLVLKENGFTIGDGGRLVKAGVFEFTLTDGGVMRNGGIQVTFLPGAKITVENGVLTGTAKDEEEPRSFKNAKLKISGPKEGGTPVAGGAVTTPAPTARGAWAAGTPKPNAGAGGQVWETTPERRRDRRSGVATGGGRLAFTPKKYELEEAKDGKDCIDLYEKKRLKFVGVDTTHGAEDPDNFYAHVTNESGTKFKKYYFTKETMADFCEEVLGVLVPEGTFPFYVCGKHYIEFRTIRQ